VVGLVGVEGGWSRGCRGFASVVFVAGVFFREMQEPSRFSRTWFCKVSGDGGCKESRSEAPSLLS
jgi:hypothetical protein